MTDRNKQGAAGTGDLGGGINGGERGDRNSEDLGGAGGSSGSGTVSGDRASGRDVSGGTTGGTGGTSGGVPRGERSAEPPPRPAVKASEPRQGAAMLVPARPVTRAGSVAADLWAKRAAPVRPAQPTLEVEGLPNIRREK